jgi:endonuclease/exonuclease/phosphatase family metal-dependent hydrolase
VAISLLLAYVAPYIKPSSFWPIAFFGLALPYLYLLNVLFLLIWVALANVRFILPLLILIIGYESVPRYFQLRVNQNVEQENAIKVMSFNVRVFDLYMWSKDKSTRNQIFEFLNEEQPDVLCLQEFYQADSIRNGYEFKTLDTLVKFLNAKNYHTHYTTTLRKTDHWGLVTFSRYPILNKGVVPFKESAGNSCIYTDLKVGPKIYRIYNAHLASIKLNKHDYKAMKKINQNDYSNDFGDERLLVNKLKAGFIRRADQADSIRASIESSPYPVILCGDFNDTPSSYAYQTLKGELIDGFVESGSGFGQTYIGEFPSFRIDYIFHDDILESENFTTHSERLSDHHPISVYLHPR